MDIDLVDFIHIFPTNKQHYQISNEVLDYYQEQYNQPKKDLLFYNKTPSIKQNNSYQQIDAIPLKKKINGIKKNKVRKLKNVQIIVKQIENSEDIMYLSTVFTINNQGIIKLGFSIENLNFGFQKIQMTNYLQNKQIIQVCIADSEKKQRISVEQALDYIQHTPCKQIQEARDALLKYKQNQKVIQNMIQSINYQECQIQLYNEEVQKHLQSCNQYIQQYAKDNQEQMFQYLIGRVNFEIKDAEILESGYSKSFLELIGLNASSLSFLLMRNQKIELIKDQEELMKQQLTIIQNSSFVKKELKLSFKITTFDGFEIQLYVTKKQISPNYEAKKFSKLPLEYIFALNEFDVELDDLKNLISYRQRILSNKNELTFDEFINKEISLLFENVEYSVHSQSLIEKFYQNNLDQLQSIKDLKIKCKNQKKD
ncbi:hypothetical protein ABPG72_017784 [Tetrahymena utriculariae]